MTWTAKADQCGRVTLPKSMLVKLGVRPGDELDFGVPKNGRVSVTRRSDGLRFMLTAPTREAE